VLNGNDDRRLSCLPLCLKLPLYLLLPPRFVFFLVRGLCRTFPLVNTPSSFPIIHRNKAWRCCFCCSGRKIISPSTRFPLGLVSALLGIPRLEESGRKVAPRDPGDFISADQVVPFLFCADYCCILIAFPLSLGFPAYR